MAFCKITITSRTLNILHHDHRSCSFVHIWGGTPHAPQVIHPYRGKVILLPDLPEQAPSICNVVILSNFNYCPSIWLFCNKIANKKIDRAHEPALRILYNDYDSSFQSPLRCSNSYTIHVKNLQKLMNETYKSLNNMNPSILLEFHEKKCVKYDLRKKNLCKLPKANTISHGVESISFKGSFLWNTLDDSIK